ncbi:MAG: hypothetical protein L6Q49_22085 [Anaerolineales bacterium]|nr:hypothetical protein [Anaerolineales bacterium]
MLKTAHSIKKIIILALIGVTACNPTVTLPENIIGIPVANTPASEATPPVGEQSGNSATGYCVGTDHHPIGQNIASTYDVPYEIIIAWYCSGYSFEDILIALETADAVDVPAAVLLEMSEEKDWEEIWKEVGFVQ